MKQYNKNYRKGGTIDSLDELVKQEFIYFIDKITHRGWFMSWQIRLAKRYISQGMLFCAEKIGGEENV